VGHHSNSSRPAGQRHIDQAESAAYGVVTRGTVPGSGAGSISPMTRQPTLDSYEPDGDYPPLVRAAVALTRRNECSLACLPEVGQLLRILAATVVAGRIVELGTAYGVGAAWIASGMRPGAGLVPPGRRRPPRRIAPCPLRPTGWADGEGLPSGGPLPRCQRPWGEHL